MALEFSYWVLPKPTTPEMNTDKTAEMPLKGIKLKSECGRTITVPRHGGGIPGTFGRGGGGNPPVGDFVSLFDISPSSGTNVRVHPRYNGRSKQKAPVKLA